MKYKEGEHQYTEWEMRMRIIKVFPKILKNKGFDILVTHAPAYEINDGADLPTSSRQSSRRLSSSGEENSAQKAIF